MPSEVELLEVFRLAEAAGLDGIATAASDRLVWSWLGTSRFHDTRDLTRRALMVGLLHFATPELMIELI